MEASSSMQGVYPENSSMAVPGRLAAVPVESADGCMAAYPPCSLYRDLIRGVAVSGTQIRSVPLSRSQFGHNGFSHCSDSGASNSCPSNNSGCSSDLALSAAAVDFGTHELKKIAHQMGSDGYTLHMVQAFDDACNTRAIRLPTYQDFVVDNRHFDLFDTASSVPTLGHGLVRVLDSWFFELDVDCVLQIPKEQESWFFGHGSQWQLQLLKNSGLSLQDLVERWIRGLTVIVHSIELDLLRHERAAVARFGKESISKMLVFVDAIVPAFEAENLRAVLDMYICVRGVMNSIINSELSSEVFCWSIMLSSLITSLEKLIEAIPRTMENVKTLIEKDDSWAIEIPRGGGEVHRNTRWIADCIVSLGEADDKLSFLVPINGSEIHCSKTRSMSGVRDDTIRYLKDLLLRKSELSTDPSLRYLFLLNNSYFVAQMIEPCVPRHDWKLTPECEKYMHSYLNVSWGDVLSCIPKSHFPGPLQRWINTSSLAKFESAFNKTYQVQKFWKVPDPQLRHVLRRAITQRVVSSYRDYLKEHPELAEHSSRRNSSPQVLEEMLGQLFEG